MYIEIKSIFIKLTLKSVKINLKNEINIKINLLKFLKGLLLKKN